MPTSLRTRTWSTEHPPHVGGKDDGNHHGKPLRNRHDDDGNSQGEGMDQVPEQYGKIADHGLNGGELEAVADDDGVEQIGNDDQHRREISQTADGAG